MFLPPPTCDNVRDVFSVYGWGWYGMNTLHGYDRQCAPPKYEYNAGGQVQKVSGAKPGSGGNFTYVEDIGYDEFGQRVYMKYGNGVTTTYQYDPKRKWLKHLETNGPQGHYQDITYTLDAVGNVLQYKNSAGLYETTQNYEYDGLYQLTKVNGVSASDDHKTALDHYRGTYEQSYSFDAIGNMTKKTSTGNTNGRKNNALTYTLNYEYEGSPHRASRIGNIYYEYDGNGNLLTERYGSSGTTPGKERILQEEDGVYSTDYGFALTTRDYDGGNGSGTNERSYTWNERNQLRSSVDAQWRVEYRYGADGQRAIKYAVQGGTEHSETLYFNKMLQVGRIQKYGTGDIESKHIYVGETRIVTKQRTVGNDNYGQETGNQYYYHGDHLGSAQVVTNYKGELYEHIEYTPYGELWVERTTEEGNLLPFRFTAKEYDRETGLYYYGARYLDPRTSRWISTDPAMGEYIPGAPINDEVRKHNQNLPGMGGVFNYVNLHVYHYAGNNPIKLVDPNGQESIMAGDPFIAKIREEQQKSHFERNQYQNGYAPSTRDRMDMMVEMGLFTAWRNTGTHNLDPENDTFFGRLGAFFGGKKGANTDYRGAVGTIFEGMQFIYGKEGNLVLDSANKGTFDIVSPDENKFQHFSNDVLPWLNDGNGPADNPNIVPMSEKQWSAIESIYNQFRAGKMTKEQAAAEVQKALPPPLPLD